MSNKFEEFGVALKAFRVAAKETVEDVSGAVEIEPDVLANIEKGKEVPPVDILELLIIHFQLRENDATRLWELAGYSREELAEFIMSNDKQDNTENKELRINLPGDSKVLYTDMVQVMSNKYGVVLNFIQGAPGNSATVVARLGMSKEHAKSLLEVLQRNMEQDNNSES